MKKLLYTLAGLSALALFASCNKEAERPASPEGEVVTATFTVAAPEGVATKADIGDGTKATDLIVAVYDEQKNYLQALSESAVKSRDGLTWTVSMKVIKDLTYQFVFIAKSASDNGFCTFTPATGMISIDYGKLAANSDDADFFFVQDKFKVEESFSKPETMHRPLAQVNFGASDLTEAGYSINTETMLTGVKLTGIYSEMNVLNEEVTGTAGEVTFTQSARVPAESPKFVDGYDRVAMVYALVAKENQSNVTATLNVKAKSANAANTQDYPITREVANVPLKRNYRTNILGNIFTNDFNFTVQTVPGFAAVDYNKFIGPAFGSVADLNAYFEKFADNSDNGDVDPEVVKLTGFAAGEESTANIVLPKYSGKVQIRIMPAYTGTVNLQYAASGDQPSHIDLFATKLHGLVTDIDNSHLTILHGSVIETGDFITGSSTLEIQAGAKVGTANIQKGNVEIAGEVTLVNVEADAVSGDTENTKVQVSLAPEAQVTTIELNAPSDVVVEQPKGNIDDVDADPGDSNPKRNNVKVVVASTAAGSTATALNDGSIYLVAEGDVLVSTATDESATETDSPSVYVVSVEDDVTVTTDEEKDGQVETAAEAEVTPIVIPEGDNYYVTTASKLVWVVSQVYEGNSFEGKTIILGNDIDLQGVNIPVSYGDSYVYRSGAQLQGPVFKGTFDGNDKTILNLNLVADKNAGNQAIGLFGGMDGAVVKNVNFTNVSISGGKAEQAGVVAGLMTGGSIIENVKVLSGSVSSTESAGGIAGRILVSGIIRNCENNAVISTTAHNAGGIVGMGYFDNGVAEYNQGNTRVENCVNNGAVTSGTAGAGGIAGLFYGEITGCTNNAAVAGNTTSVGGILGEAQSGAVIGCTNNGAVTNNGGSGAYGTGGIVGWIRSTQNPSTNFAHTVIPTVSGCTNNAHVAGGSDAGGIVGTVYVTANIVGNTSKAKSITAANFAAGIVGNYQKTENFPSLGLAKDSDAWKAAKLYLTENVLARPETFTAANKDDLVYDNTQGASVEYSNNSVQYMDGVVIMDEGVYGISSAAGLLNAVSLYTSGGTFKLLNDIDMSGIEYSSPVVDPLATDFVFDGNGKTISNLRTKEGENYAGLFGTIHSYIYHNVTIKNLTIKDAILNPANGGNDENSAGALVGWIAMYGDQVTIENVTAENVTVNSAKYAGGLIGYSTSSAGNSPVVSGCTVKDCTINSAYTENSGTSYKGHAGGVIGYADSGILKNTTLSGTKISYTLPAASGLRAGALLGTAQANAVIGEGNKVTGSKINEVPVAEASQLIGVVDNRTNKTTEVTIE